MTHRRAFLGLIVHAAHRKLPKGSGAVLGHLLTQPVEIQGVGVEFFFPETVQVDGGARNDFTQEDTKGKDVGLLVVGLAEQQLGRVKVGAAAVARHHGAAGLGHLARRAAVRAAHPKEAAGHRQAPHAARRAVHPHVAQRSVRERKRIRIAGVAALDAIALAVKAKGGREARQRQQTHRLVAEARRGRRDGARGVAHAAQQAAQRVATQRPHPGGAPLGARGLRP